MTAQVRALLLVVPLALAAQQRTANTALALHVQPEARLTPSQVTLQFHVAPDGAASVITQTELVDAWMRPAPHQQVHLSARLENLSGPNGLVSGAAVTWAGTVAGAAGGGQSAACTGGRFDSAAGSDLASGWQRAGKLSCSVTFALAGGALAPGDYTGTVALSLTAE